MVEMVNAVSASVQRPIQFFHLPVPKPRTDEAFYVPLEKLNMKPDTDLYLGLIHHNDDAGNATRLAAAGATPRSTASAPNAAWRAATRPVCRRCSPPTPARPISSLR